MNEKTSIDWFHISNIKNKILSAELAIDAALQLKQSIKLDFIPSRNEVEVRLPTKMPPRQNGLSTLSTQAQLIHDLANIELQAAELCIRTLIEYADAPRQFRFELSQIAKQEIEHLNLCIQSIESLGFKWGSWPVHLSLWMAVSSNEPLYERIMIVHRYLEGSGLDSGVSILRRLQGVADCKIRPVVEKIVSEEVAHVEFGSKWFQQICSMNQVNESEIFNKLLKRLSIEIPRRQKIAIDLRRRAGFSEKEIHCLQEFN